MTQHTDPAHLVNPAVEDVDAVSSGQIEAGELALQNIGLVTYLVQATMARVPSLVDRDDLRSAGLMALVKASRSYQPDRGASFATYATTRIRGALLDELRSVDWASRSVRRKAREVEDARSRLANALGHFPDDVTVAAALGIDTDELVRTVHDVVRAKVVSLDEARDSTDEHGAGLIEEVASPDLGPEARVELAERLEYLRAAIAELPEPLRAVVEGYFLHERPMAAIACDLGVTESRISQMRAEALSLLREGINASLDPHLLPPATSSTRHPNGVAARRRHAYAAAVAARQLSARRPPATSSVTLAG